MRRHLLDAEGRVLCGQDRRTDPGPLGGEACRKCRVIREHGGRRVPLPPKCHLYAYTVVDDLLRGGRLCTGHPADARDVPACARTNEEADLCRTCSRAHASRPPSGDPAQQVLLSARRRTEVAAYWERVRRVFEATGEAMQQGTMSRAEAEIRFRTALIKVA